MSISISLRILDDRTLIHQNSTCTKIVHLMVLVFANGSTMRNINTPNNVYLETVISGRGTIYGNGLNRSTQVKNSWEAMI